MKRTLHITNGRSVSLTQSGIGGEVLSWDDPLHEGPVPDGLSLDELSDLRAQFLAAWLGLDAAEVRRDFEHRNTVLKRWSKFEDVVLWFEHDLYDQLQLLLLLDYFARQNEAPGRISLVQSDRYLGPMEPSELAGLYPKRRPITVEQLSAAVACWSVFRSPDPLSLVEFRPVSELPYVYSAFRRHLDEYPSRFNGLGRTQRQLLEVLRDRGPVTLIEAFRASQAKEEAIFLGDTGFYAQVRQLAECRRPLLSIDGDLATITDDGRAVLARRADHVELNGIDRWLGGVHLTPGNIWRW